MVIGGGTQCSLGRAPKREEDYIGLATRCARCKRQRDGREPMTRSWRQAFLIMVAANEIPLLGIAKKLSEHGASWLSLIR